MEIYPLYKYQIYSVKINRISNQVPVTTPRLAAIVWITRAAHDATNMIQSNWKKRRKKDKCEKEMKEALSIDLNHGYYKKRSTSNILSNTLFPTNSPWFGGSHMGLGLTWISTIYEECVGKSLSESVLLTFLTIRIYHSTSYLYWAPDWRSVSTASDKLECYKHIMSWYFLLL